MYGCSRGPAPKPSRRCTTWRSALALGLLSGCTDPVFTAGPVLGGSQDGAAGSSPVDSQRGETPDSGFVPPASDECEGGTCRADASVGPPAVVSEAGASDGGPAVDGGDAALDEVRALWAGHYATRSALFTFDDPLKGSARLLTLVDILPTPEGGLRLEEELCYFEGDWTFFFTGVLKYRYIGARGSVPLTYDHDSFEAERMTLQIGYGPSPAGCNAGATMPRGEAQSWLASTCDCPRSNDPPTSPRDCRVGDPEQDKEPGATFTAALDTAPLVFRVTQEERVQLFAGYRRGDRLYADRWFEDTTRILSCTLNGTVMTAATCPLGAAKACPMRHNKVEFASLKEPLTCAQVIAMEQALFLAPLPDFPAACPSEIAAQRTP